MSRSAALSAATALTFLAGLAPTAAQPLPAGIAPPPPGGFAIINRNNTGADVNVIIPRGATGADTYMSNSAAGGNASRPELAVPNGSTGGGSGGTR
jgi:hypothetical protein